MQAALLEIDRLKRENAQLATALLEGKKHITSGLSHNRAYCIQQYGELCKQHQWIDNPLTSTALRDLLNPTLALLNDLDDDTSNIALQERIKAELARLRAGVKGINENG